MLIIMTRIAKLPLQCKPSIRSVATSLSILVLGLQAETNPYYVGPTQRAMPWQLQAIFAAVSFSCPGHCPEAAANALMSLLSGLLHPDPALRTTAEAVSQTAWLAELAEAPLPRCPTKLSFS